MEEFLAEVHRSGVWINQNGSAAIDLFAEQSGIERSAIAAMLVGRRFGADALDDSSLERHQDVADTLLRARRIQRPVAVADARWSPPPVAPFARGAPALRARR